MAAFCARQVGMLPLVIDVAAHSAARVSQSRTMLKLGNTAKAAWKSYGRALEKAPVITKAITSGVLFSAADVLAQKVTNYSKHEKDKKLDMRCALRLCPLCMPTKLARVTDRALVQLPHLAFLAGESLSTSPLDSA